MSFSVPVLMYHSIAPRSTDYLTVACARFRMQVDHLADRYKIVGLRDIEAAIAGHASMPRDAVVLTFDDGLWDNVEHAVPVLEARGTRAVFFVIASVIGGDTRCDHKGFRLAPHMTTGDLQTLARAGHEVGNHSLTHQRLSKLPYEEQEREIALSHDVLTAVLGRAPGAFAYQYGDADAHSASLCRARYKLGFTTVRHGCFDWEDDPAQIRRIYVAPTDGPEELDHKIACYCRGVQHT